jgi:hypothetical protein
VRRLLLLIVILGSCTQATTDNGGLGESPQESAVSPSPTAPPEPTKPSEAPLEGDFRIRYLLIQTNVQGEKKAERRRWVFDPKCAEGPCDARVESTGGLSDWKATALYLGQHGRYRWVRRYQAFTCTTGDVTNNLPSVTEYLVRPVDVRLVENEWVVSKIEGTLTAEALKSCGLVGVARSRYAIRGTLRR